MSVKGNQNASKFSDELVEDIIEMVTHGHNIVTACKLNGISYSTWCNWKRDKPTVLELYARARQDKAEYLESMIDEVLADLRKRKIHPSEARIFIDTLKWKMSKFYPKMFGTDSKIISKQEKDLIEDQIVIYHIPDNGR